MNYIRIAREKKWRSRIVINGHDVVCAKLMISLLYYVHSSWWWLLFARERWSHKISGNHVTLTSALSGISLGGFFVGFFHFSPIFTIQNHPFSMLSYFQFFRLLVTIFGFTGTHKQFFFFFWPAESQFSILHPKYDSNVLQPTKVVL